MTLFKRKINPQLRQAQGQLSTTNTINNGPQQFLYIFFKFAYFFYLLPYKFVNNASLSSNQFVVKTNLAHKIICPIVQFLIIFRLGSPTRLIQVNDQDQTTHFKMISNLVMCIYKCIFFISIWAHKSSILNLLNDLSQNNYDLGHSSAVNARWLRKSKAFAMFLCVLNTTWTIACTIASHGLFHISEWNLNIFIAKNAEFVKFMFFLQDGVNTQGGVVGNTNANGFGGPNLVQPRADNDIWQYILALISTIFNFYKHLTSFYTDLYILMCILTFYYSVVHFTSLLQLQSSTSNKDVGEMMVQEYHKLKTITNMINQVLGEIILGFLIEAMPYYASELGNILFSSSDDLFNMIRETIFVLGALTILLSSAYAAYHVQNFHDWLNEGAHSNLIHHSKLVVILSELNGNRIGISSVGGLFTITYGFVGGILSIILTYTVIMLQLKT